MVVMAVRGEGGEGGDGGTRRRSAVSLDWGGAAAVVSCRETALRPAATVHRPQAGSHRLSPVGLSGKNRSRSTSPLFIIHHPPRFPARSVVLRAAQFNQRPATRLPLDSDSLRLRTPTHRLRTPTHRLRTPTHRLRTPTHSDSGLRPTDSGLRPTDSRLGADPPTRR